MSRMQKSAAVAPRTAVGAFAALAVLATMLLAVAQPAAAQDWKGRGRLQGLVKDEQGKPVVGAKVTLRKGSGNVDENASGPAALTTDKSGHWGILGLSGGAWGVLIEAPGFIVSQGQVNVEEEGPPSPPITVTLKVTPKEQPKQPSKTSQANESITKGNDLLKEQKYADARAEYQKALDLLTDPATKVPIMRGIASTYYRESVDAKTKEEKQQKLDQAIDTLKQTLTLAPTDTDTLQLMVNLLVGEGKEAEARTYMAQMPAGAKIDPEMMINIGIKYYNAKQLDKALEEFNKVVEENPNLPDAYYYRGLVNLNLNKSAAAKADFTKLLELDPNSKWAAEAKEYIKAL